MSFSDDCSWADGLSRGLDAGRSRDLSRVSRGVPGRLSRGVPGRLPVALRSEKPRLDAGRSRDGERSMRDTGRSPRLGERLGRAVAGRAIGCPETAGFVPPDNDVPERSWRAVAGREG